MAGLHFSANFFEYCWKMNEVSSFQVQFPSFPPFFDKQSFIFLGSMCSKNAKISSCHPEYFNEPCSVLFASHFWGLICAPLPPARDTRSVLQPAVAAGAGMVLVYAAMMMYVLSMPLPSLAAGPCEVASKAEGVF